MKLDEGGNPVWRRFLGGTGSVGPAVTAVGRDGAVYVAGLFTGVTDLDPGSGSDVHDGGLSGGFHSDIFLIKLTAGGEYVWGRTLSSGGSVELYGAQTTPEGNVIINGSIQADLDLDPGPGTDRIAAASGRGFLLELAPDGSRVWSRQVMLINDMNNPAFEMSVGADGAIVYGGQFMDTVDLDPTPGVEMHTSAGKMDPFVVKLNAAGDFQWARQVGSANVENGFAVVDRAGNVYLGGIFLDPFRPDPLAPELTVRGNLGTGSFLIQYDRDGTYRWSFSLAGDNDITTRRGVAVPTGGIVVAGSYAGNANFDPVGDHVIYSRGLTCYYMHVTPEGRLGWVKVVGGQAHATTRQRLAAIPWGGVVIGDEFRSTVDFDPGPGVDERTSDYEIDGYVLMLGKY